MEILTSSLAKLPSGIELSSKSLQKPEDAKSQDLVTGKPEDEVGELKKQLASMQLTLQELKKKDEETSKQLEHIKHKTGLKDEIQLHLEGEAYNNISKEEGMKMLSFFTEKSLDKGYPWKLQKPGGKIIKRRDISIMDAVQRLSKGEEIIMQPMRIMDLDLSPKALATVASVANPTAAAVAAASQLAEKAQVTTKPIGHEVPLGAPVTISSFGELKLLTELYDPNSPVIRGDKVSETAKELGKFIQTVDTNYPWKIMKPEDEGKLWRVIKASAMKGFKWGVIGLGVGAIIGGIGGLIADKLASFAIMGLNGMAATAGAVGIGSGIVGSVRGAGEALVGKEISSFEALGRMVEDKPIILQKQKIHSVDIPIFGTYKHIVDYGKPNNIYSKEDLNLFAKIIPVPDAKPAPPPVNVVVNISDPASHVVKPEPK